MAAISKAAVTKHPGLAAAAGLARDYPGRGLPTGTFVGKIRKFSSQNLINIKTAT
jgi:hypothetical protein